MQPNDIIARSLRRPELPLLERLTCVFLVPHGVVYLQATNESNYIPRRLRSASAIPPRREYSTAEMELHTAKEDFLNMHVTKVVKNKTISRDRRRVNKTAYCDYVEPTTHTFQRRQATHPPNLRTLCRMAPNYYFVHSKFSNFSARTKPPTQQLCRYFTPLLVHLHVTCYTYLYLCCPASNQVRFC